MKTGGVFIYQNFLWNIIHSIKNTHLSNFLNLTTPEAEQEEIILGASDQKN